MAAIVERIRSLGFSHCPSLQCTGNMPQARVRVRVCARVQPHDVVIDAECLCSLVYDKAPR